MAITLLFVVVVVVWYAVSSLNSVAVSEAFHEGVGLMQLLVLQYVVGVLCSLFLALLRPLLHGLHHRLPGSQALFAKLSRISALLSSPSSRSNPPSSSLSPPASSSPPSSPSHSLSTTYAPASYTPTSPATASSAPPPLSLASLIAAVRDSLYDPLQMSSAAMHVTGSLATLASLRLLRSPFVQMSKALEPVFGALLAFSLGFPMRLSLQLPLAVCISLGIALTAVAEALVSCWNAQAFILALLSCVCFQLRNILSKHFMQKNTLSGPSLYMVMCWPALGMSLVVFLFAIPLFPDVLGKHAVTIWSLAASVTYTVYNTMSYTVLSMVASPFSHALLGTLKRAVVVVSLSVLHQTVMPPLFALGALIALAAGFAHVHVAQRLPKVPASPLSRITQRNLLGAACMLLLVIFALAANNAHVASEARCVHLFNTQEAKGHVSLKSDDVRHGLKLHQLSGRSGDEDATISRAIGDGGDGGGRSEAITRRARPPRAVSGEAFACKRQLMPWFSWDGRVGMWRTGNFGDDVNRDIAAWLLNMPLDRIEMVHQKSTLAAPKFLGAGSVLSFVGSGDVVWGSGCHEKSLEKVQWKALAQAEVYAVRGPLICKILGRNNITHCGGSFGDPGLLAPLLYPDLRRPQSPHHARCWLPHYTDRKIPMPGFKTIFANQAPRKVAEDIAGCGVLLTTSLHGIVFAESFGVPVAWLRNSTLPSSEEGMLKYRDYITASRRVPVHVIKLGDTAPTLPPLSRKILLRLWRGLVDAFPFHRMCEQPDVAAAHARLHALIDDYARSRGWET